jgi:hypothetical protein
MVIRRPVITAVWWCLLFALLIPIWSFPYFPSSDGPSHLFNAYVFVNYEHVPVFQKVYSLHVPTAGNLAGHGLAILFMKAGLPWDVCEKLLVTICIAALALAFYYAVSAIRTVPPLASFLIFPFLYNWPLQMGFWSFSLGVPFLFVCAGLVLRNHGRWRARPLIWLFLVAGGAYICHPIAWAVCALTVAIMAVGTEGWQLFHGPERGKAFVQIVLPVAVFVPFAIPNALFAEQNALVEWQHFTSIRTFLWPLYTDTPLHLFAADSRPARALFLVLVLASIGNFARKIRKRNLQTADVLLPPFLILLGLGLVSPGRIGEGTFIAVRLLLFGYLLWVLWLAMTLPRRAVPVAASIAVLFTAWLVVARLPAWRAANRSLTEIVALGRSVPANAFVCQLDFLPQTETVRPLDHVIDLLPAKNIVDVRDYEAGRYAFWTRFRPGYFLDENYIRVSSQRDFEGALNRFEQRTGKHIDFLVLTEMTKPPDATLRSVLPARWKEYQLVRAAPPAVAIYRYAQ